jgi:alpha-1,3-rhamnosyl/mannosyltransferase
VVQTLHDLTPLALPSPETEHDARRWRRSAGHVRRAARVVAVSRSSADQAMRLLDVDPRRIEVVPNGVDPRFTPGPSADAPPYLLFVAAWGPHKGHAEAFATIAALAEQGYPHELRVVGPNDEWMSRRVDEVRARSSWPDRVELVGYVADDVLVDLYRGASALVFTSRGEGFGLPVVEAMACATPVVAFDNSSMPEVAGEAGVLVADGDVDAFVAAVRRVLDDDRYAGDRRAAGVEQAARFRWENAVARYEEIFLDVGRST